MGAHTCGRGASLQPSPRCRKVLHAMRKTACHHSREKFSPSGFSEATKEPTTATAAGPVLSALPPARRPQQAQGAARETAGATAAGPVTFNARRDYELLEQVVSTYGR